MPYCLSCDAYCSSERYCSNCSTSNINYIDRNIVWHESKTFDQNPSKRFLGLELEVDGCYDFSSINTVSEKWSHAVVSDGSLNGPDSFELRTAPTNGDKFIELVDELGDAFVSSKAQVDRSCGFHVHVDARDMNHYDLSRLITLYSIIEPALYKIVSKSRHKNHFCSPCGELFLERFNSAKNSSKDISDSVANAIYAKADKEEFSKYKRYKEGYSRYYALNIHSWNYRGSIECRLHQGTVNKNNIVNWPILWASILDMAKQETSDLPTDPRTCLLSIAPNKGVRNWIVEREKYFANRS